MHIKEGIYWDVELIIFLKNPEISIVKICIYQ